MGVNRISFSEKGVRRTLEDERGNIIDQVDYPIPGWEEMDLEEKTSVAAQFAQILEKDAKRAGVSIEKQKRYTRQERRRLEREFGVDAAEIETILASMLRNRQLEKAPEILPKINETGNPITISEYKKMIETISDKQLVSSYITCPDCGSEFISYHDAIEVARHSKSIDEWSR